ncbi:MAG TPA: oxaloacetate decarboxylase [Saprospiraceae bacterium]|nr:oxaloacetate decarboxylase [Saprospiraceae bacterium]HRX29370.1 oxaloacetate decarboxylase [Saprospiraceae bacterium]
MRRKEIKLALVYRDMWQSSGKYVPRVDQLTKVAPEILKMGVFDRVETNGGGFEQVNLLFGENPNTAVREWTQAFNDAGVQTQMLERGINGLRMSPIGKDLRKLMFKLKKIQGTDIARSFDGLNNPQNLALSFQYAKEGGMVAQGALSLTHSPLHTVDYYIDLADKFIDLGAEEICLKDMAGVARPHSVGLITKGIRERHPDIIIQYHGHTTPGFAVASSLEAAYHGADIIDVGMEPLSWGTGHADLLTIHAMLKDAGFKVKDINMKAYMKVRSLTQEFIDDFLGYYIADSNRKMNSLLIGSGLPGGMMGSLMADLESNLASLNKWLEKNGKEPMTSDDLFVHLLDEVEYAWPKLGYPPLVTPYSQYVKNVSLMNAINMIKGKGRWSMIDENTWDMLLGRQGQLLGSLGEEIVDLANDQGREFYTGNPQDLYSDSLEEYRVKMKEKGWETGKDDEELFEYAMHPVQYEAYKSGAAKKKFEEDLEQRKSKHNTSNVVLAKNEENQNLPVQNNHPTALDVTVEGTTYHVQIDYPNGNNTNADKNGHEKAEMPKPSQNGKAISIKAPLEGKFFLTKESGEKGIKIGDKVSVGDTVGYIEAMKVINAISADKAGVVSEIVARNGEDIEEDEIIITLN